MGKKRKRVLPAILRLALLTALGVWAAQRITNRQVPQLIPYPDAAPANTTISGAFHIHTELSHDGNVSVGEITEYARELSLDFVVLTDHNSDGGKPSIDNAVLVIPATESSTDFGHLIEIGKSTNDDHQTKDTPTTLEDVGGARQRFQVLAHPSDRKRPWTGSYGNDRGLEIASLAASVRRLGHPLYLRLLPTAVAFFLNPELAFAQAYDRDDLALRRWDDLSSPSAGGFCAVDAHGRVSMEQELRAWRVVVAVPAENGQLPQDAAERAGVVINALSRGRFACVAGQIASAAPLGFILDDGDETAISLGGETRKSNRLKSLTALTLLRPRAGPNTSLHLSLLRNGEEIARSYTGRIVLAHPSPGTYRAELRMALPGLLFGQRIVPVGYTNKISVTE